MIKLVHGIGIYGSGVYRASKVDSTCGKTKEYQLWIGMLERCVPNGLYQTRYPSYIGCTVHQDFINFQDFAEWCQHQIGFGYPDWHLDKDILGNGSKIYGPDTCCFIPLAINVMLTNKQRNRGLYPTGVSLFKPLGNYRARIKIDGVETSLGYFKTPELAECAYKNAKMLDVHRHAENHKDKLDPRVYQALMNYTP